jgi:hypothetical protein
MANDKSGKLVTDPRTEAAIRQMETQAVNFGYRFINDATVRQTYMAETKAMAKGLRDAYQKGNMSAKQAAESAKDWISHKK